MIQRCTNPNSKVYKWYGARGITVCDRWLQFQNFFADMGLRPAKTSLERKDNEKGYEFGNCVWATRHQQMRNTSYTRFVNFNGEKLCVRDACAKAGIPEHRVYYRVWSHKIPHQEAFDHYLPGGNTALGALAGQGSV